MTLRNSLIAGSLLFIAPGCEQKTEAPAPAPAPTAKPATPTAPSGAATAPAPGEADKPKPKRMDPCTNEGEHAVTASGIPVECEKGRWDDVGVGFVGVTRACANRVAGRRVRA